jgi:hypothetical protein
MSCVHTVPWDRPRSVYDSVAPPDEPFDVDGVRFSVKFNGEESFHTGRDRFEVKCLSCDVVVHPNTNGPQAWIRGHLRRYHNFQGELKYQDEQ